MYGRIAKNLGVDEETVRKRVEGLRKTGLIRGWQLVVNPTLFGMGLYAAWMTVSPQLSVNEAIRKIKLVNGVVAILHEVGDALSVGVLCEDEKGFKKRLELMTELVGGTNVTTYSTNYPKQSIELTRTDWEIIRKLKVDPTQRFNKLARGLGLSSRTVKRRLSRMTEGRAIFIIPDLDYRVLEGAFCIDIFVHYTASGFKTEVDGKFFTKYQDFIFRAGWGSPAHGHFTLIVPSIAIAQEIVDWLRGLNGVREVKLSFVYDWLQFFDEAVDELIRTNAPV